MSTDTPTRYTPDDLGRWKVSNAGAGDRFWLSARIGHSALDAIGAEPGDYIVVTGTQNRETSLHVELEKEGADT